MCAEHGPKRFLKQMGGTVVPCGEGALLPIHGKLHRIADFDHAFRHDADMPDFSAQKLHRILYPEFPFTGADVSGIRLLTAAGRIERRLLHEDRTLLSFRERIGQLVFGCQHGHAGLERQVLVSHKGARHTRGDGLVYRHVRAHVVRHFAGIPRFLSLYFHACVESLFIHAEGFLLQDFLCQVQREAVSVIQAECIFAV